MDGRALVLAVLLAAPCGTGCSFLSVRGPPTTPPTSGKVECTDHYGAPVGDAFVGTIVAAISVLPLACFSHGVGNMGADLGVGIGSLALAATLLTSSVYGFVLVSRCTALRGAPKRALAQHAWLPESPPGPADVGSD